MGGSGDEKSDPWCCRCPNFSEGWMNQGFEAMKSQYQSETKGTSGFPFGNIVDFLETDNMFTAGPRTSCWGANRQVSHLESTQPFTRRSGTEEQTCRKL